jgi:tungstate transport system ATP-binding protein
MQTQYTLQDVKQIYEGRTVLHIPQMHIKRGEVLAIVGPSGAGKSTLLRMLALLESPAEGKAYLHDGDKTYTAHEAPMPIRRKVAMVFQRPVLMSRSVTANVAYGLKVRGLRNDKLVEDALARVSMAHLAGAKPQTLSGGEMQRVSLARALVIKPSVLLLDEPTANLDPANVRMIESILHEQNEKYATTIILVTHNIFQAKRLAHRVAFIYESELVELADNQTFFEHPKDPRTQDFVSGDLVW